MSMHSNHPFHLVNYSPWPLTSAMSAMILMVSIINWFHLYSSQMFMISFIIMLMSMYQWWRDIARESTFQGFHTMKVYQGMKYGMILFIVSEVFFFISFFWAFFHNNLTPSMELGSVWPPISIFPFNPFQIPLLNTIILLSSGISVTWAHHSILQNNFNKSFQSLLITVLLGIYFSMLQGYEYLEAPFSIADSIYSSTFFIATGFHGLHVLIGTLFLLICLIRLKNNHFSNHHHFGFEAAAWYWHFVDVVWLFLYIIMYWWSS